jgi:hypothetical protein
MKSSPWAAFFVWGVQLSQIITFCSGRKALGRPLQYKTQVTAD